MSDPVGAGVVGMMGGGACAALVAPNYSPHTCSHFAQRRGYLPHPGSPLSIFTHKKVPVQYLLVHTKDGVDAHLSWYPNNIHPFYQQVTI
jgi:hypothetical protein